MSRDIDSRIDSFVDALKLDVSKLEADLARAHSILRRCLKQMRHGRPSFPEQGEQWDRVLKAAEKELE